MRPNPRPSPLPLSQRIRTNLLNAPVFFLATGVFGSLGLLASFVDQKGAKKGDMPGRLQHRLAQIWAKACVFASGSRVQVIGLENIPQTQSVYASNHTSYMDTPVVFASLPFQFRILAKKELWNLPFIGWYLDRSGQIPVDTENPRATISSLSGGVRAMRDGLSVFVFPEGGRTPDGHLQPFLNGAAYLAIRAQVPLVPIALVGVYDLLPIHTSDFYHPPGNPPLKLIFGTPISTDGRTLRQSEALTAELREAIASLIAIHS